MPPLTPPNLDDRTFDDIVKEVLNRIPKLTPEWTDVNLSDPGVALVELFAHKAEMIISRINKLPDKAFVEFLRLIGVELLPAEPATVRQRFRLEAPQTFDVVIPKGTEVSTIGSVTDPSIVYATDEELVIPAGQLEGEVGATAVVPGTGSQVGANKLVVLRNPIPYVASTWNPAASSGGADEETLEEAKARGPTAVRAQDRAATREDHADLALKASAEVKRATAIPLYDPAVPDRESLGHTTVVILPDGGGDPAQTLIDTVRDYLEARDYTSARVHVTGPIYVTVDVTVSVKKLAKYTASDVQARVQQALDAFLDPFSWEWGRDVHWSDLVAVIEAVEGVDYIESISPNATVTVPATGLAVSGTHTITVT